MKFANPLKKLKTIASTRGHVIDFPGKLPTKDDPDGLTFVYVPLALHAEAIAAGLMSESELEEAPDVVAVKAPEDAVEREAAVFKAFDIVVARGERDEFGGNGAPKVDPVSKELGWKLDAKELKGYWPRYQARTPD